MHKLAETAADYFDNNEVLDDPDHEIWDWAVEVSEENNDTNEQG